VKNEIVPFKFDGWNVRTVTIDGDPWVFARDFGDILGIANVRKSIRDFPANEKAVTAGYTLGGEQEMTILNEPGMYRLIFQSRKPDAERIKAWVFNEVLPQIRRTGSYSTPAIEELKKSLLIAQSSLNTYKRLWEEERRAVKRHERRNFLTNGDKREILALHASGYPISAIQGITKKGRVRIKNFIDGVLAMDDAAMDAMFAEWERAESLGRQPK